MIDEYYKITITSDKCRNSEVYKVLSNSGASKKPMLKQHPEDWTRTKRNQTDRASARIGEDGQAKSTMKEIITNTTRNTVGSGEKREP